MKLLQVDASILGEHSVSRQLSAVIAERLRQSYPDLLVTYYDLGAKPLDHQETYLRGVFGFFGITDIAFVRAEGLNVGADQRKAAIAAATAEVARLAA